MGKTIRPPLGVKEKYPAASKMLAKLLKGEPTDHVCKRFKKPSDTVNMDFCVGCEEVCVLKAPGRS